MPGIELSVLERVFRRFAASPMVLLFVYLQNPFLFFVFLLVTDSRDSSLRPLKPLLPVKDAARFKEQWCCVAVG